MSQPTFNSMQKEGQLKRADAFRVRLEDIHEEPGFNELARDYDSNDEQAIEELAAFIKAGGTFPPLEVRPRSEGGVWLVDGHLRSRALRLLDSQGDLPRTQSKADPAILEAWVDVVQFIGNDAERVLRLATSAKRNTNSALALGRIYTALISAHKWTVQQIAQRSGVPVATIKRALDLASGNTDVHEMVKAGEVKPTLAAAAVRKHGDKAGEVLATQLEVAKAQGKKRVTAAVQKLTFDQWFEGWAAQGCGSEQREAYKAMFQTVWTAARAGK